MIERQLTANCATWRLPVKFQLVTEKLISRRVDHPLNTFAFVLATIAASDAEETCRICIPEFDESSATCDIVHEIKLLRRLAQCRNH